MTLEAFTVFLSDFCLKSELCTLLQRVCIISVTPCYKMFWLLSKPTAYIYLGISPLYPMICIKSLCCCVCLCDFIIPFEVDLLLHSCVKCNRSSSFYKRCLSNNGALCTTSSSPALSNSEVTVNCGDGLR